MEEDLVFRGSARLHGLVVAYWGDDMYVIASHPVAGSGDAGLIPLEDALASVAVEFSAIRLWVRRNLLAPGSSVNRPLFVFSQ